MRGTQNVTKRNNGKGAPGGAPFHSLLQPHEQPNAFKDFTTPADNPRAMLMRTVFEDEKKATACALLLHYYDLFDMGDDCAQLVLDKQAAMCSVKGRSTILLLFAITGIVAPSLLSKIGKFGKKLGKVFGQGKDDSDEE